MEHGVSTNVMSSWRYYNSKERTILEESVKVSLSVEKTAILICEKRGHVAAMLRSDDPRLNDFIVIADG